MKKMKTTIKLAGLSLILLVAVSALIVLISTPTEPSAQILRFKTGQDLLDAFENAQNNGGILYGYGMMMKGGAMAESLATTAAPMAADASTSGSRNSFSETNVQVQGVDEADIIKTDGEYIYMVANGKLAIALAYPGEDAKILSETKFEDFNPTEIFIDNDRLMLFGNSYKQLYTPKPVEGTDEGNAAEGSGASGVAIGIAVPAAKVAASSVGRIMPYFGGSTTTVKLYDVSDRENPKLLRDIDFEGSYLTSRKIGTDAYFVINSYPHIYDKVLPIDVMPMYKETGDAAAKPIALPTEVGYVEPLSAQNFISVISLSMTDENKEFGKEVIAGNGQNVYASLENLYIAQLTYPTYDLGELVQDFVPKTIVTKFALDEGKIDFVGTGQVNGRILNQFSMDEFESNFRIATTIEGYDSQNNRDTSTNNMYVLDEDLSQIGAVEGIAPGESIYSVRFIGERAYMVTFKHVDPLFVIDLSEPTDPKILGKLKIPGYSEYLHPYDATHLIGIGKEVDESIDADKIHTEGAVYYTAIQGVKLAIFDVSDVSNPIELHKEVIGDRGTTSEAETNHKAFLFDKEKGLLVIPVTVAELKPGQDKSQEGEFVFQGAYVYDVSLDNGFALRGKVTHIDDQSVFDKAGSYFYDYTSMIQRSLYINDILYTFSNKRLQLNDLDSLDKIKELDLGAPESPYYGDYPVRALAIE